MTVNFYDSIEDSFLKFAVIVAKQNDKWVFCKHKERSIYGVPGGHRDVRENISDTAKRELGEETGATGFTIPLVCVYSVIGKNRVNDIGDEIFGMLYYADIKVLDNPPLSEIEQVYLFDELPEEWTYPIIQPKFISKVESTMFA